MLLCAPAHPRLLMPDVPVHATLDCTIEPDDGIDAILTLLDAQPPIHTPCEPPANTAALISAWRTARPSRTTNSSASHPPHRTSSTSTDPSSSISLTRTWTSKLHSPSKRPPQPPRSTSAWTFREDCLLADIFTSVAPQQQPSHVAKQLPSRSWTEAKSRFRHICRSGSTTSNHFRQQTPRNDSDIEHNNPKDSPDDGQSSLSWTSRCPLKINRRIRKPSSKAR